MKGWWWMMMNLYPNKVHLILLLMSKYNHHWTGMMSTELLMSSSQTPGLIGLEVTTNRNWRSFGHSVKSVINDSTRVLRLLRIVLHVTFIVQNFWQLHSYNYCFSRLFGTVLYFFFSRTKAVDLRWLYKQSKCLFQSETIYKK